MNRSALLDDASRICANLDAATVPFAPWLLWPFSDAPVQLQALSQNGGDEDWILVVPAGEQVPFFAEEGSRFGCCTVEVHELSCGRRVLIGCHA